MPSGAHSTCAFVRQRFWVFWVFSVQYRLIKLWARCQQGLHPFERAGLDNAGPLGMHFNQPGRRPVKVYLCVFMCFSAKACHLERRIILRQCYKFCRCFATLTSTKLWIGAAIWLSISISYRLNRTILGSVGER
ncbi:hypothetical protein ACLKA7_005701 [Drosophila subpalustris]